MADTARMMARVRENDDDDRVLARPVDLHLRIRCRQGRGRTVFRFDVQSPSQRVPLFRLQDDSRDLPVDLGPFSNQLVADLDDLIMGRSGGALLPRDDVAASLRSIGKDLYETLLPPSIRDILDAPALQDASLLVESDETWVPWELLHTTGDRGDFLCQRYRMGRWLTTKKAPPSSITVSRILGIDAGEVPGQDELSTSAAEIDALRRLAASRAWDLRVLTSPTHATLIRELTRGDHQIIHFVGHGGLAGEWGADRAALALKDRSLVPRDLVDGVLSRVLEDRPFVFLNACRSAHQGHASAGLGGWPDMLVRRGHCGGFLAPQWLVASHRAEAFSSRFYDGLQRGETIGEAVRYARRGNQDGAVDPSTLAYVFYGNPNATIGELGHADASDRLEDGDLPNTKLDAALSDRVRVDGRTAVGAERLSEPPARHQISARRSSRAWSGLALLFVLIAVGTWWLSDRRDVGLQNGAESSPVAGNAEAEERLRGMLESLRALDTWIVAMFGLTIFLWVTLQALTRSKVGQFDGAQTLHFFRLVVILAFVLSTVLALLWWVRDITVSSNQSSSSKPAEQVQDLVLGLKSDDPTVRRQAMTALVPFGRTAANEVVQVVSEEAGVIAGEWIGHGPWEALLKALGTPPWDTPFFAACIWLLGEIGEPAVAPIYEQLAVESAVMESVLNEARVRTDQAEENAGAAFENVPFLLRSAGEGLRVNIVRETLVRSLLEIGPVAIPALQEGLESPSMLVSMTSYQVAQGMPEAHEPVARKLCEMAARQDDEQEAAALRQAAAALKPCSASPDPASQTVAEADPDRS